MSPDYKNVIFISFLFHPNVSTKSAGLPDFCSVNLDRKGLVQKPLFHVVGSLRNTCMYMEPIGQIVSSLSMGLKMPCNATSSMMRWRLRTRKRTTPWAAPSSPSFPCSCSGSRCLRRPTRGTRAAAASWWWRRRPCSCRRSAPRRTCACRGRGRRRRQS